MISMLNVTKNMMKNICLWAIFYDKNKTDTKKVTFEKKNKFYV